MMRWTRVYKKSLGAIGAICFLAPMKRDSQTSVHQNQILQLFDTLSIKFLHTLQFREFQITQKQFDYSTETITTTRSPFYPSLLSSLFLLRSSLSSSESLSSFSLGGRRSLSLTGMTTGIREWPLPVNHVIRPADISIYNECIEQKTHP